MPKYQDIPKNELEKLYRQNLLLAQIGEHFSVSQDIIKRALEFHQIPKRKRVIHKPNENPDEHRKTLKMAELYRQGATLDEVGKLFGLTRQGVRWRFNQSGISYRRAAMKHVRIDKKRLEKFYSADYLPLDKIAAILKVTVPVINKALNYHQIPKRGSIIKGAYRLNALKNLKIGESIEIKINLVTYHGFYSAAKRFGIKVSVRTASGTTYRVTRIA